MSHTGAPDYKKKWCGEACVVDLIFPQELFLIDRNKEWELEKETKVNSDVLLIKSSGIILIFLHAFYLIIWPMTHQRIF